MYNYVFKSENMKIIVFLVPLVFFFQAGNQKPTVVSEVDLNKYAGSWYEIARLPNYFERKLKCTSATYTLREDGKIQVVNKGHYIKEPEKTSSVKGIARIPDKSQPAKLKVQFFWPFAGDYWIMYLDREYRYALIGDPSLKYLWILSREKTMDEETYNMLKKKAIDNGYDISSLIRVEQDCR